MKLAIYGYGKLGKAAERDAKAFPDIEVTGVFTRRDPATVETLGAPVYSADSILDHRKDIDVVFIAGGSATDLPVMTPQLAKRFDVIDSFDTHARIPAHFAAVDKAARSTGHLALISAGWDPGLFSLARLYSKAVLPIGRSYTFWGKGVSQGHSDAIRRIEGVKSACQYTIPREEVLSEVRSGNAPELSAEAMHIRDCYVVLEEGADTAKIEEEIKTMPNYFAGYETFVHFITQEEYDRDHSGTPHGGFVIRSGATGEDDCHTQTFEFNLRLDSNPEFTAGVILAYARAVNRMSREGQKGCRTVFDVPPAYLLPLSDEEIRSHYL